MEVVLVGNPNSGKTSLFNRLTGLHQKVGNYPGITVDKREGNFEVQQNKYRVVDLPGIYSLFPGSDDERIAVESLIQLKTKENVVLICLIDVQSVQKNLLLLDQLVDFGLPVIGVFNYRKKTPKNEIEYWMDKLAESYDIPWFSVNANSGEGIDLLKSKIPSLSFCPEESKPFSELVRAVLNPKQNLGREVTIDLKTRLEKIDNEFTKNSNIFLEPSNSVLKSENRTIKLDNILMHPFWGYVIFGISLLFIFQAVFSWAEYPMNWIDSGFGWLSEFVSAQLPSNFITNAITQGIIPGLAGVVIFIPQIAFLFLFIALFEESGYMTRVVYLMDRLVKPFGLSGRSVVPLISGYACAIPAIMATRTIKHPREKLITMLVIPFMTCSARIPVYTTLIALLVSEDKSIGPFNAQGLILLAMYLFGAIVSFLSALVIHSIMAGKGRSLLLMELPNYKTPSLKNTVLTVYEKSLSFVTQAGKIILAVSIVLYLMANVGFNETFKRLQENDKNLTEQFTPQEIAKLKLENSLIGQLGKTIEPVIKPLGYDWKIGISLITSFAAREVFVGTMSTIYALEDQGDNPNSIVQRMRNDTHSDGSPKYGLSVILSLLVFYALALQCLGTVAVMVKESGGWKWALIQLAMASGAAYFAAFAIYQVFK